MKVVNKDNNYKTQGEWEKFLDEFAHESDRATAILGAAYLDNLLKDLITNFFVDDRNAVKSLTTESPNAPLGSFSARINIAYCLGLIDKIQYQDLIVIRQIRNLFAHSLHGLSFHNDRICRYTEKLKAHKMMVPNVEESKLKFMVTIMILTVDVNKQAELALANRRSIPDYYGFIGGRNISK